jgi:hypothetical protein
MSLSPAHLLDTTTSIAPWCRRLEPMEMSLLLIAVPFIGPVRRADFPRRLSDVGITESLIGALYFQRIDRTVEQFVKIGAMEHEGASREKAYRTTAKGFAAILLNLSVLDRDPTLDGTEFELKREIAAALHVGIGAAIAAVPHLPAQSPARQFFEELFKLEVLGRSVVSNELLVSAADVHALINRQRQNVGKRLERVQREANEMHALRRILGAAGLGGAVKSGLVQEAPAFLSQPEFLGVATALATSGAPEAEVQSRILRYQAYTAYLDRLSELYGKAAATASNIFTLLAGADEAPAPMALPGRAQRPKPRRSQTNRGVKPSRRKGKGGNP